MLRLGWSVTCRDLASKESIPAPQRTSPCYNVHKLAEQLWPACTLNINIARHGGCEAEARRSLSSRTARTAHALATLGHSPKSSSARDPQHSPS